MVIAEPLRFQQFVQIGFHQRLHNINVLHLFYAIHP